MSATISSIAQDAPLMTDNSMSESERAALKFTKSGIPYTKVIRYRKDIFTASYNKNGVMESSTTHIYDGQLPLLVSQTLAELSGWKVKRSLHTSSYDGKNTITKLYRVNLRKDGKHRTIFLDSNGDITNYRLKKIDRATALARFNNSN